MVTLSFFGKSTGDPARLSRVHASKSHLSTSIQGERVILNTETGKYFALNEVASRIWELIQVPNSLGAIAQTLVSEYKVELAQVESDAQLVIDELVAMGLAYVSPE